MVDCSQLPVRVREDLFLASRDRIRECAERQKLEDGIVEYLKDHPGLRELNARRREALVKSALSDEETEKIIQHLIKTDPTLAALFGKGRMLRGAPGGPSGPLPEYIGRPFPTYFRPKQGIESTVRKQCPRNRTCRIEFETDASNDYFSRVREPGTLEVAGSAQRTSIHLWNGAALVRLAPPESASPGDRVNAKITVSDPSRTTAFETSVVIDVVVDSPEADHDDADRKAPKGPIVMGLPKIVEIRRNQWSDYTGFNEATSLRMKYADDGSIDAFVNMDNLHLRNEILRRRTTDPAVLNYCFKFGLLLLALGMLERMRQRRILGSDQREEERQPEERPDLGELSDSCDGMAITLIPVILNLGKGRELLDNPGN